MAQSIFNVVAFIFGLQFLTFLGNDYFSYFFVACIAFYFLTQVVRCHYSIGIITAFAFAYSSNIPILVMAGHHTKILSIAYMPYFLGAIILLLQKHYVWGMLLGILSGITLFSYGHYQVIFYVLVLLFFLCMAYVVTFFNKESYRHLVYCMGSILIIVGFSVSMNMAKIMATKDYATTSTRSGSKIVNTHAKLVHSQKKITAWERIMRLIGVMESSRRLLLSLLICMVRGVCIMR